MSRYWIVIIILIDGNAVIVALLSVAKIADKVAGSFTVAHVLQKKALWVVEVASAHLEVQSRELVVKCQKTQNHQVVGVKHQV